ncbi:MAG: hypothetical protein AAGU19_17240 [Prolixibacteraceae bacterium]
MTEPRPTQPTPSTTPSTNNEEVDLLVLAHSLWGRRRFFFRTIGIFAALGILIATYTPKEYRASTTMIPQMARVQPNFGGLSGLASMAGINLNAMGNTSDIAPTVYPQIITSVPFQLELMQTPLHFKELEQPVSLYNYYLQHEKPTIISYALKYTFGLPGVILNAIKGKQEETKDLHLPVSSPLQLTRDQKSIQEKLESLVSLDYNNKEGYVTLTCTMPEALPAAQLTLQTQRLLQQYITAFKVQKAKANLEFIEQRYSEVKKQYEEAQRELATFRDRNRNVATATAQTEFDRLNNNYNLIYGVYSELAKQLEQSRIQVKEDTPVFTIIKPVFVPLKRSKPQRLIILAKWLLIGTILGIGITVGQEYILQFRKRWKSIESD